MTAPAALTASAGGVSGVLPYNTTVGKPQYHAKPLSELVVGVQRVAVTMPLALQELPQLALQGVEDQVREVQVPEDRKIEDCARSPGVKEVEEVQVAARSLPSSAPGLTGWQGGREVKDVTNHGQKVHLQHGLLPLPAGIQRRSRRQLGQDIEYVGLWC